MRGVVVTATRASYFRDYRARQRDAGRDRAWQDRAGCLGWDPEIFFADGTRSLALHACHYHCPVIRECLRWTRASGGTSYAVQGGVAWNQAGKPTGMEYRVERRCARCP